MIARGGKTRSLCLSRMICIHPQTYIGVTEGFAAPEQPFITIVGKGTPEIASIFRLSLFGTAGVSAFFSAQSSLRTTRRQRESHD